jgi:RND family efflux transporter MFP subunit
MLNKIHWIIAAFIFSHGSIANAVEIPATALVQIREVSQTYRVEGVVEATRQSTVSAQIGGRVKEVHFDVGDIVKKGQVLLLIDEREANQAVLGSQAQLQQSQAALQNAKTSYERAQQLFTQKFISQAALDKAQADFKMAEAQAAANEAAAKQSVLAQTYTAVLAPYSGVVSARMVELGEMVTMGKPLMTGFDPTQMRVLVSVPQSKLADIGRRPQVKVELPQTARFINAASVTIQPAADVRTHSTPVKIVLLDHEAGVYPGMFVRAHFAVGKVSKMLIPASAVVRRSEVVAVYVVDEKNQIRLRQVRVAETSLNNEIEVLSGLTVGERVAIDAIKAGILIKSAH